MADLITPTTTLEAVNWGLAALGFTPVNTLEGVVGRDASTVQRAIENEARNVCRRGMWFSRRDLTLTPDGDGFLVLPANALKVQLPSDDCPGSAWARMSYREDRPTMRQGKVFSIFRQSYVYTQPLTVGLVEALGFEDLPDEARQYVMVFSALEANRSALRSEAVIKALSPLLNQTWMALLDAELSNSNYRFT